MYRTLLCCPIKFWPLCCSSLLTGISQTTTTTYCSNGLNGYVDINSSYSYNDATTSTSSVDHHHQLISPPLQYLQNPHQHLETTGYHIIPPPTSPYYHHPTLLESHHSYDPSSSEGSRESSTSLETPAPGPRTLDFGELIKQSLVETATAWHHHTKRFSLCKFFFATQFCFLSPLFLPPPSRSHVCARNSVNAYFSLPYTSQWIAFLNCVFFLLENGYSFLFLNLLNWSSFFSFFSSRKWLLLFIFKSFKLVLVFSFLLLWMVFLCYFSWRFPFL